MHFLVHRGSRKISFCRMTDLKIENRKLVANVVWHGSFSALVLNNKWLCFEEKAASFLRVYIGKEGDRNRGTRERRGKSE